jgi:hypothetical protein
MKLWLVVRADADHHVHTCLLTSWDSVLNYAWTQAEPLSPKQEERLEDGQVVPTKEGWLLARLEIVAAPQVETKSSGSSDRNKTDAIAGLCQLGFTKAKSEEAVSRATMVVGADNIDKLVTESLRQAA